MSEKLNNIVDMSTYVEFGVIHTQSVSYRLENMQRCYSY